MTAYMVSLQDSYKKLSDLLFGLRWVEHDMDTARVQHIVWFLMTVCCYRLSDLVWAQLRACREYR
jgi:hypothetical protein